MTTIISDTFSGSGNLNKHLPDAGFLPNLRWRVYPGNDPLSLSGGYASNTGTGDMTLDGLAFFMDTDGDNIDWGLSDVVTGSLVVKTGASVTGSFAGGGLFVGMAGLTGAEFGIANQGSGWVLYCGTTGVTGFSQTTPITVAPNTEYTVNFSFSATAQSATLGANTVSATDTYVDPPNLGMLSLRIGRSMSIGSVVVNGTVVGSPPYFYDDTLDADTTVLDGRTPSVNFGGEAWSTTGSSDLLILDTYQIVNPTASAASVGFANFGDLGAVYDDAPAEYRARFYVWMGSDIDSSTAARPGASITLAGTDFSATIGLTAAMGDDWLLQLVTTSLGGTVSDGPPIVVPVVPLDGEGGQMLLEVANGVQTLTYTNNTGPYVATSNTTFEASTGLSHIHLELGGNGCAMSQMDIMPTEIAMTSIEATLTNPMGALSAEFGFAGTFTAPMPSLYAAMRDTTGENAFAGVAPMGRLVAEMGMTAALTAPAPVLNFAGTTVDLVRAELSAPMATVSATSISGGVATADLRAPMATLIGYGGMVCAVTNGVGTLQANVVAGSVGRGAFVCPLFQLDAEVTRQASFSAALVAPMPLLDHGMQAYLVAPMARLSFIGHAVVTATYEAYSVNLSHRGEGAVDEMTRYTNFPFDRIVRYQNSYFGVAATGLYLLEGTTDFAEPTPTNIPYAVKTGVTDMDSAQLKTVVAAYLGARLGPSAEITLYAGEEGEEAYPFTTPRGQGAQNHREKFGRGVKNRYFAVGIAGDDTLELSSLDLETLTLKRRI